MAGPDIETYRALTTAFKAIEGLAPTLRDALTVGLPDIHVRLGAALASRDPEMFKAVFEELYAFAESELGDGEFLAMLRPYIVPILGAAGATEAGVSGVSTALAAIAALGTATAEMIAVLAPVIFWPAAAAVVAVVLFTCTSWRTTRRHPRSSRSRWKLPTGKSSSVRSITPITGRLPSSTANGRGPSACGWPDHRVGSRRGRDAVAAAAYFPATGLFSMRGNNGTGALTR